MTSAERTTSDRLSACGPPSVFQVVWNTCFPAAALMPIIHDLRFVHAIHGDQQASALLVAGEHIAKSKETFYRGDRVQAVPCRANPSRSKPSKSITCMQATRKGAARLTSPAPFQVNHLRTGTTPEARTSTGRAQTCPPTR